MEDAVFAAKKGQAPPEMPVGDAGMPNCENLLSAAILEGLTVRACRVCCSERGLHDDELIAGVQIGTMLDLVNWVVESEKVLFF
jgi:tRNA 2-thiouridine synthesizing protein D